MCEPFDQQFWTELKQERRRIYTILLSTTGFALMMPFARQTDHFLAIGLGCISLLFVLVFVPGRWFCQARPRLDPNRCRPEFAASGPRPALRKQPPPATERLPVTHWPLRTEPLPPLPPLIN